MERIGICLACHQDIPDGTPSMKKLRQILKKLNRMPATDNDHKALLQSINRNASNILDRIHGFPLPHDAFIQTKEQGKGHQGSGIGDRKMI